MANINAKKALNKAKKAKVGDLDDILYNIELMANQGRTSLVWYDLSLGTIDDLRQRGFVVIASIIDGQSQYLIDWSKG